MSTILARASLPFRFISIFDVQINPLLRGPKTVQQLYVDLTGKKKK